MSEPTLFLGSPLSSQGQPQLEQAIAPPAAHLSTHCVILGMTGSGKTGLGIVLLEEALRQDIPALIIDPKGDMGNLALRFPKLAAAEFAPWVEGNKDPAAIAQRWEQGLGVWGIGKEKLQAYQESSQIDIYTPGSTAGQPINIVGNLQAPKERWETHSESLLAEIQAFVGGLLGLCGIKADPLASPEYILLSNLIQQAWMNGRSLDLPSLIVQIQDPPLRKLGVFEIEQFFPKKERQKLAMRINGLVANPSFANWLIGAPLDMDQMLRGPQGQAKGAVVSLAHLNDEQRQFVVTLLLSKMVTWMRQQPGTSSLRALVYMDEVFGYAPPTANPPSKTPILTILKQARAHGVGMVLSTQNPVDLDYKAMSNAGMWIIGRLQTENDKARVLEGLRSAGGGEEIDAISRQIGELDKRQFVFHSTKTSGPSLFSTRWAMSYLRGPLTLDEISRLSPQTPIAQAQEEAPSLQGNLSKDESPIMPKIAADTRIAYLDPASPLCDELKSDPQSRRFELGVAVRVNLTFDEKAADLDHHEEWEAIYYPLQDPFEQSPKTVLDYDARDFKSEAPQNARYVTPAGPVHTKAYIKKIQSRIKNDLYRNRHITIYKNAALKAFSRVDESQESFQTRCEAIAQEAADLEIAKLHEKAKRSMESLEKKLTTAQRRLASAEEAESAAKRNEMFSGVGAVLGAIFGSRSASSLARKAGGFSSRRGRSSRSAQKVDQAEEKIDELEQEMQELQEEIEDKVDALRNEWSDKAQEVEPFEVDLERSDIVIDEVVALWIPSS